MEGIQKLTPEVFRQQLAGLTTMDDPGETSDEYRSVSARVAAMLARNFGPSLDAKTKWDRIGSAIPTACAKSPDGDPETLLSAMLEHVKAVPAAAYDPELESLLRELREHDATWRDGFVAYLQQALYAVLVFGRELHGENTKEWKSAGKRSPNAADRESLASMTFTGGDTDE